VRKHGWLRYQLRSTSSLGEQLRLSGHRHISVQATDVVQVRPSPTHVKTLQPRPPLSADTHSPGNKPQGMSLLAYIYARFYDISMGHYTWFVVTCNDLSLAAAPGQHQPKRRARNTRAAKLIHHPGHLPTSTARCKQTPPSPGPSSDRPPKPQAPLRSACLTRPVPALRARAWRRPAAMAATPPRATAGGSHAGVKLWPHIASSTPAAAHGLSAKPEKATHGAVSTTPEREASGKIPSDAPKQS
jgi:hypothetical protein